MLYSELTAEQKRVLDTYVTALRSWCGEQAKANNHGDVVNTAYNAEASAIITSLDAAEVVPNVSGLAQAASLTKEEIVSMTSHVQGVLTNYNTSGHRQLWVKAAGIRNLMG